MTILEQITATINSYEENYKSPSGDLLLNCQDKLTTLLYTFSDDVATAYENYLQAKLDRKMGIADKIESYIAEGMNKTNASMKAEIDSKELYENENKWDSNYKRYKMLLDQGNEVVGALKQRISQLKHEKSY